MDVHDGARSMVPDLRVELHTPCQAFSPVRCGIREQSEDQMNRIHDSKDLDYKDEND